MLTSCLWTLLCIVFLTLSVAVAQEEKAEGTKGRKKKVGDQIYASFGLPADSANGDPIKVIPYSKTAVYAASSKARTRSSPVIQSSSSGAEPSAPGCPQKVDLRPYMSAVEDQRQSNSCAANAVAGAYEYLATRAALRDEEEQVGEISRLFIYYVGRKRDQINRNKQFMGIADEGMTLQGAIEAVQLKGAALQSAWPFELQHINRRPSEQAFSQAMRYKVGEAMKIEVDLNQMRQVLNDGYPIIFGLKLTSSFFQPDFDGFIATPDASDPRSASHGLHAMLIVGYNDRQKRMIVRNSWGTDWGSDGYCFLSYDYVANPDFNFVGMYAIQSLSDDDLTPDEDDGHDLEGRVDPDNTTPYFDIEDVEFDLIFEEDELDAEDMFDSKAEARRAFLEFAGDSADMATHNLQLSKAELAAALKAMGIPMVTDEEIDMAFNRYDDDKSGFISFYEFLDMQELFDGSLLARRRTIFQAQKTFSRWWKKTFGGGSQQEEAQEL